MRRRLVGWIIAALALGVAGPAAGSGRDAMAEIPSILEDLERETHTVWTDARPMVIAVTIARREAGLETTAEITFVSHAGVIDATMVVLGDELPTTHLQRREEDTPQSERARWEQQFAVLRKFRWHHCNGEWLEICALPRPEDLGVGEALYLTLEVERRTPLLILRHSEGDAACRLDRRGTVHPFFEEGP